MPERCRTEAAVIESVLDDFWMEEQSHIRSRRVEGGAPEKLLDCAVILGANHAGMTGERYVATLRRLETLFDAAYPINRDRPSGRAPALGRYAGDKYYSGGAYYFSTLGAAEFCYRSGDAARGDAYLETVRAFTPQSGDLSEQFDQVTGAQTSAKHLAWSYAAFLTAVAARRRQITNGRLPLARIFGILPAMRGRQFSNDSEIARAGGKFLDRSLPKPEWTHAAHFAVTLWLVRHRPDLDLDAEMPSLIRAFNEATGTPNTDTGGYHETITRASLAAVRAALAERRRSRFAKFWTGC